MAGSGRRVALEVIFLTGLAVAAGLADLTTSQIIGVMALGWAVTVLIELVSWRLAVRHPAAAPVPAPVAAAEPDVVEAASVPVIEPDANGASPVVAEPEPAR